jgi:hypothetical protein
MPWLASGRLSCDGTTYKKHGNRKLVRFNGRFPLWRYFGSTSLGVTHRSKWLSQNREFLLS